MSRTGIYAARPCPCGHKNCRTWHVSPVADIQGVSFTEEQARAVADLLNQMGNMTEFEMLLACYRSGQISERQWQEHLKDREFREWVEALRASDGFGSTGIAAKECCGQGGPHSWQWDPRIENDRCVNCGTIRQ